MTESKELISCPEQGCEFSGPTMRSFKSHYGRMHGSPCPYERKTPYGPKYQERRAEALERDDYTCQFCGVRSFREGGDGVLHVHHEDEDKTNNGLSNLTTLCRGCHRSSHARQMHIDDSTEEDE